MIFRLTSWPYVCVGRGEVVLVIEVYLKAAIKIQKGEPRLVVRLNIPSGRFPAFFERKFLQQLMK